MWGFGSGSLDSKPSHRLVLHALSTSDTVRTFQMASRQSLPAFQFIPSSAVPMAPGCPLEWTCQMCYMTWGEGPYLSEPLFPFLRHEERSPPLRMLMRDNMLFVRYLAKPVA